MSQELSDEDFPMVCDDVTRKILPGMEVTFNPESPDYKEFQGAVGTVERYVAGYTTLVAVQWHDMPHDPPYFHKTKDLVPKHDNHSSMMAFIRSGLQASQAC